jgi:putative FmdB family regulatory protein
MPVYEYRCLECGEVFEARAAVEEADAVPCPHGHGEVKRLVSSFIALGGSDSGTRAGGCPCGGNCGCGH